VKERAVNEVPPDTRLDTVIVGGGQAGLALGYHLRRAGRRFVIVEAADHLGGHGRHVDLPILPGSLLISVRRDLSDGLAVETGWMELSAQQVVVATDPGGTLAGRLGRALWRGA
jgi:predicted NAD/FAD-binding protein